LQNELNAFNERIAELEDEGHRGHAMEVLKANALDFARQIDELRCLLLSPPRSMRLAAGLSSSILLCEHDREYALGNCRVCKISEPHDISCRSSPSSKTPSRLPA
jgi:hypothetical protein